jgi:hypothetical protein
MTFETWFVIATKKIAESELPKLRNELENHFLDSIAAHLQAGRSRVEAERQAVLELGDPTGAARGFEREYLTKRDWRRINTPTIFSRSIAILFVLIWWGFCEAIMPNLFSVFGDKANSTASIFRFMNISSFAVHGLLLLVQILRVRISAFQWRL